MKQDAKVKTVFVIVFSSIALWLWLSSVLCTGEFPITTDPHDQENPAIYKDMVIWHDNRNGNWDIYGYNLLTHEEFPITTDPHDQRNPAIYGDMIVWDDTRHDERCIYGYNLVTGQEVLISKGPARQYDPGIYKDVVVWVDERHKRPAIYGYNLTTEQEFSMANLDFQWSPEIYGEIVVWQNGKVLTNHIYGYNLVTHEEFEIAEIAEWEYGPSIYEDVVVWADASGLKIVNGYNLVTSDEFCISRDFWRWCNLETVRGGTLGIYEDIVVWIDYRDCTSNICGYNLLTDEEFFITDNEYSQYYPAIYGDVVVWTDDRNGNADIYGFNLNSPVTLVPFVYKTKLMAIFVGSGALAAVSIALVSSYIREGYPYAHGFVNVSHVRAASVNSPRTYKRNTVLSLLSLLTFFVCTGVVVAMGYFSSIVGIIWTSLGGVFLSLALWFHRTPYVRMTKEGITLFVTTGITRKVQWDHIREITIHKDRIEIAAAMGLKKKMYRIWLAIVHKKDREKLITFLTSIPLKDSDSF